ncbi:MAG: response regulator [Pararhodobacter sp.]|nr:response regulator [Pararhodobacter sp.]
MDIQTPTPRKLSILLTLMAVGAVLFFLATLLFVASQLAAEFNTRARIDTTQRMERGIEGVIRDLETSNIDYSEWTAHYLALQSQDYGWLAENVGAAVYPGGPTSIVVLGGGPLDTVLGWSVDSTMGQPEYQEIIAFSATYAENQGIQPEDHPVSTVRWMDGALWLMTANLVVPNTEDVDPVLPTATLIFGVPLRGAIADRLGHTLLLSDLDIQPAPGTAGASLPLDVIDGPDAWVTWPLPSPGTAAMFAVAVPIGGALSAVIVVLGLGTYVVRRFAMQLESALTTAEAASRAKSDFLSTMSHELRTPLTGVLGMADLLAETRLTKQQRDLLETIQQSGGGLLSLVNDVLDLARVESGKLTLEARPFALASVLAKLESVHSAAAQAKGITLHIHCSLGCAGIRLGDEMRVVQILHNVMGNAVKFTKAGSVTLNVSTDTPDTLVFRVTDTGIGMTDEQTARIFEAFEQADAGTTRRFGGTGLGMSIVRSLVDTMDGSIAVTSTPGQGTTVSIRLPLPVADTADVLPPPPAAPAFDDHAFREMMKGCRVLVAEDNATNRKIMAAMLDNLGVEAVFAGNGLEACELWQAQPFTLVLMDISMPVMDGVTALDTMKRKSAETGRAPPRAVAATANVMKAQIDSYMAKGFVDILPKPYKRPQLQEVLFRQIRLSKGIT